MNSLEKINNVFWRNEDSEILSQLKTEVRKAKDIADNDTAFWNKHYNNSLNELHECFNSSESQFAHDFPFFYNRINLIIQYFDPKYELYSLKRATNNKLKLLISYLVRDIITKFDEINWKLSDVTYKGSKRDQEMMCSMN
jgi:hypothetical protein